MDAEAIALWSLIVAIITLVVGVFVSVVLFRLGGRVDFRSRMRRADELRSEINQLFVGSRDSLREVILLNVKRYDGDYDGSNEANRHGYVMEKVDLLNTRHDGVEVIHRIAESFADDEGHRTLTKTDKPAGTVQAVGLIPFDYIEHVSLSGDEYRAEPIFYVRYKGPGKTPYTSYRYEEGQGRPLGPSGRLYFDRVDDLGVVRPRRFAAWRDFRKTLRKDRERNKASRDHMKTVRREGK